MATKKVHTPEPYWSKLVSVWFDFHEEKFHDKPEFEGSEPKDLLKIIQSLKKRAESNNIEWTEEVASKRLKSFLEFAMTHDVLCNCFTLITINRYKNLVFQKIANPNTHGKRTSVSRPAIEPGSIDLNESWR